MNQSVIDLVAQEFNLTKKLAKEVIEVVFEGITDAISNGERLRIDGVGTFNIIDKPARMARNPKTGEPVRVPAKKVVKFSPAKTLKESMTK